MQAVIFTVWVNWSRLLSLALTSSLLCFEAVLYNLAILQTPVFFLLMFHILFLKNRIWLGCPLLGYGTKPNPMVLCFSAFKSIKEISYMNFVYTNMFYISLIVPISNVVPLISIVWDAWLYRTSTITANILNPSTLQLMEWFLLINLNSMKHICVLIKSWVLCRVVKKYI